MYIYHAACIYVYVPVYGTGSMHFNWVPLPVLNGAYQYVYVHADAQMQVCI